MLDRPATQTGNVDSETGVKGSASAAADGEGEGLGLRLNTAGWRATKKDDALSGLGNEGIALRLFGLPMAMDRVFVEKTVHYFLCMAIIETAL